MKEFQKPLRFGIATILGNGKQIMSWIHLDDLVRLYIFAIGNERLNGVYNAVAPHPVTNKKLIIQLARTMRGKFYVPIFVPSFILKMVFGELSIEVLKSATVSCKKIKREGYTFPLSFSYCSFTSCKVNQFLRMLFYLPGQAVFPFGHRVCCLPFLDLPGIPM